MGLDNGIILTTKEKLNLDDWSVKPDYIAVTLDEWATEHSDDGYKYQICYWRKCWDVRHDIIEILEVGQDGGVYEIETVSQVFQIRNALINYLINPEDWSDSVWTIDDFAPVLAQQIMSLGWLMDYMEEHKGERFTIEFYDSY